MVDLPPLVQALPGRLLARGREATVHELDGGRVLRRYDDRRSVTGEVAVMRHVAEHGFRVPRVHGLCVDADSAGRISGMVLERISGPSLVEAAVRGEVGPAEVGRVLARLHGQLHRVPLAGLRLAAEEQGTGPVPAPAPPGPGDVVVHLDLHPANVLLADGAPVVIDWAMARTGPATVDTAMTAMTLAAATIAGIPGDAGDVSRLVVPTGYLRSILESYLAELPAPPTPSLERAASVLDRIGAQPPDVVHQALRLVESMVGASG
jgi:Ser/Thr protein kinase RdoA (MazF antagonist)